LTPYLSSEINIAQAEVSQDHFPSLESRGRQSSYSSHSKISEISYLSVGAAPTISLLLTERAICRLRLDLIEMLRLSLHAVDYATKGYALGLVEFSLQSSSGLKKLEYLGQSTIAASHELCEAELDDRHREFIESARTISTALSTICQHANEISSHTIALHRQGIRLKSQETVQLCERTNRLLRLCIVAFTKQKVEYAEVVLRDIDEWKHRHKEGSVGLDDVGSALTTGAHERSIVAGLTQIMENLLTIAIASFLPCHF
jgi:hypothetical protein